MQTIFICLAVLASLYATARAGTRSGGLPDLRKGDGRFQRVQLIMIVLTMAVFYPLLAHGAAFGQPLCGFVNSVGLTLCVGAFLFGVGMQLGGGCGSGTLYTVGGGSMRM